MAGRKKTITRPAMELSEVIAALSSPTRRRILRILGRQAMTAKEVFAALKRMDEGGINCRESAYKALERLVSSGLLEKFYDTAGKAIRYRVTRMEITIDLLRSEIH